MSQRKHSQLFDCFDVLSFDQSDIDAIVSEAKSLGAKTRAQANELILLWAHDRFGIKIVDTLDHKKKVKGFDPEHPEFQAIKKRKNRILARMGFGVKSAGHVLDKDPLLASAERFAKSHTPAQIKKYIKFLQEQI